MRRREFLKLAGVSLASTISMVGLEPALSRAESNETPTASVDFSLRLAPLKLELAPGRIIETVGYNGAVPRPKLRVKQGQRVTIDLRNDSDVAELVHWHGLLVPSQVDGSMEEGTPTVPAGAGARYSFDARPAGTRCITLTRLRERTCAAVFIRVSTGSSISNRRAIPDFTTRKCSSLCIIGSRTSSACRTSRRVRRPTTGSR